MRLPRWRGHGGPPGHRANPRKGSNGQSLVEFALVLPILIFILLGVVDLSRVFTSIISVESAAREAADFGSWQSTSWSGLPGDTDSNIDKTLQGMTSRACVASRNLSDFVGSTTDCTNPKIEVDVLDEHGNSARDANGAVTSECDSASRATPCRVEVELTYTFDLIVPVGMDFFGSRLGLPQQVTFTRTSIFAMSDFTLDQ